MQCREVHSYRPEERCWFVNRTHDCEVDSMIKYVNFLYCSFDPGDTWLAIFISVSASCLLAIACVSVCSLTSDF